MNSETTQATYPPGFRQRRGLNWGLIGLLYASYYMCRYNFRFATPGMVAEFGFSTFQITGMLSAWSIAYGTGQLVNGLLTDRIGGKTAMLIGATGTIVINLIFGFASFAGTFTTFAAIWLMNGYMQSFGAPGMIKMNAAWFRRTERGTFAGIFGFMIQLGQFAINNLAPVILAGFTIGVWVVAKNDWHYLFRIPPLIVATAAVLLAIFVKNTPEEAGYHGLIESGAEAANTNARTNLRESFTTIFTHPLIWFYAIAYACTGAVRSSSDQLMILYFSQQLKLNMADKPAAVLWTVNLMPLVAVLGSFSAGFVSDKFFKGHRSPVAM
ncbi:MAG: MFS transporter, partial [Verrucomicrobiota bacterium]|nr:MFS transporter [Verrucomicrobiota bacterium]